MEIMRILVFTRPQNKSCQKEGFNTQFHEPLLTDRENVLTSYFCHFGSFGAGANGFMWIVFSDSIWLNHLNVIHFLGLKKPNSETFWDRLGTTRAHCMTPTQAMLDFFGEIPQDYLWLPFNDQWPPPPPPHVDAFLHWGLSFHQRPWCKPSNGRGIRLTDN